MCLTTNFVFLYPMYKSSNVYEWMGVYLTISACVLDECSVLKVYRIGSLLLLFSVKKFSPKMPGVIIIVIKRNPVQFHHF